MFEKIGEKPIAIAEKIHIKPTIVFIVPLPAYRLSSKISYFQLFKCTTLILNSLRTRHNVKRSPLYLPINFPDINPENANRK